MTVTFNPFAAGLRQAALSIPTTSPATVVTVALTGTAVPNATGTYYGLTTPSAPSTPGRRWDVAAGGAEVTASVQITNRFGIPATGVSAAVINLTAVRTTSGLLQAYPSDTTRPTGRRRSTSRRAGPAPTWRPCRSARTARSSVYNRRRPVDILVDVLGGTPRTTRCGGRTGMGAQFLPPHGRR